MDDRSFDNLVRNLAAAPRSRRGALTLAGLGLVSLIATPLADETEAARRRRGGRKKHRRNSRRKAKVKGKGGSGKQGGRDCPTPELCPADTFTGASGFRCDDGRCSCGGRCCAADYACFVDDDSNREICCYDVKGATTFPDDADFAVCIDNREVCCDIRACLEHTCFPPEQGISPSRYRRTPR